MVRDRVLAVLGFTFCDVCLERVEAAGTQYRDGAYRPVCVACLATSDADPGLFTVLVGDAAVEIYPEIEER